MGQDVRSCRHTLALRFLGPASSQSLIMGFRFHRETVSNVYLISVYFNSLKNMVASTRSGRKYTTDEKSETSISKSKNSDATAAEVSGSRRSTRVTPVKGASKASTLSPGTRRSERIEKMMSSSASSAKVGGSQQSGKKRGKKRQRSPERPPEKSEKSKKSSDTADAKGKKKVVKLGANASKSEETSRETASVSVATKQIKRRRRKA
ncbi:hypothetical protein QJS10_CPB18g02082 [Acorus calamus]|uniref:Uncharacterized protein n=1 Tax=Acorus calamus TaxID=4465 RepID=A0AAV9CRX1_ACOCL|nr:hypothetical protein QJS10_CPB18g02082 [Acorus calamus]